MSDLLLLIFELIGTVAFAISGAMTGLRKKMDIFGVMILGLITSVGGGVIRDTLAGDMPYIFVKHFYATASLIGAIITSVLWFVIGGSYSMLIGAAVIFVLRLFAARFHWKLPKFE